MRAEIFSIHDAKRDGGKLRAQLCAGAEQRRDGKTERTDRTSSECGFEFVDDLPLSPEFKAKLSSDSRLVSSFNATGLMVDLSL